MGFYDVGVRAVERTTSCSIVSSDCGRNVVDWVILPDRIKLLLPQHPKYLSLFETKIPAAVLWILE